MASNPTQSLRYKDLSIQHKIAMKEIITSKKTRDDMGVGGETEDEYFKALQCLVLLGNTWQQVINYYFSDDPSDLSLTPTFA